MAETERQKTRNQKLETRRQKVEKKFLGPALSFHGFAEELVDSGLISAALAL
jgi:hypothetical protein